MNKQIIESNKNQMKPNGNQYIDKMEQVFLVTDHNKINYMESELDKKQEEGIQGLILLSGLPGSGKSTIARQLMNNSSISSTFLVTYDRIQLLLNELSENQLNQDFKSFLELGKFQQPTDISEVLGKKGISYPKKIDDSQIVDFSPDSWKASRYFCLNIVKVMVKRLIHLNSSFIIILDDNFLMKSMRKPFYQLSGEYSLGYCEVHVMSKIENCLLRNSQRKNNENVPQEVILKASEQYESSVYLLNSIQFNNENELRQEDIPEQWEKIRKILLKKIVKEEEKETSNLNPNSLIHNLDIGIRGVVNKIIQEKLIENKNQIPILSISKNMFLDIVSYWLSGAPEELKNFDEMMVQIDKKRKVTQEVKELALKNSKEICNKIRYFISEIKYEEKLVSQLKKVWIDSLWINGIEFT